MDNEIKNWEALIRWESEGIKEVPAQNLASFHQATTRELKDRGYSHSEGCWKNPLTGDYITTNNKE